MASVTIEVDTYEVLRKVSEIELIEELEGRSKTNRDSLKSIAESLYYALRDDDTASDNLRSACEAIVDKLTNRI